MSQKPSERSAPGTLRLNRRPLSGRSARHPDHPFSKWNVDGVCVDRDILTMEVRACSCEATSWKVCSWVTSEMRWHLHMQHLRYKPQRRPKRRQYNLLCESLRLLQTDAQLFGSVKTDKPGTHIPEESSYKPLHSCGRPMSASKSERRKKGHTVVSSAVPLSPSKTR